MSTENKKNIVKMATIFAQEGKWDKAIIEYKKLITLDPTDFNIHNMLGDAYAKKADDALAYQEYMLAAEAYQKQGLADKANILFKKIGRLDSEKLPDKDRQRQILIKKHTTAEKFIEGGEIDKAIATYKEIIQLSPANFETFQKLGELYAEKGDKPSAQEYYKKIVDIYFKNRLYKKALPIYQKILEMEPNDISAREKIAEIYEREANESDAKREYLFLTEYYWKERNIEKTDFFAQKAVEFKSIEAHFFKGAALYSRKELGEAKKELEMLLKFKANHAGALTVMACIYRDMGQMDEALSMLDKVIKTEPENTDAIEELAELYIKKGLNKEAAAKYMIAISVFNNKQAYDKSTVILNKVLAFDPENIDVLSKLGETLTKQNKKKEAADAFIKISEIYKKENMADKANEYYKMAENADPAHPKIVDRAKKLAAEPPKAEVKAPAPAAPKQEQKPPSQEPPAFKIQHNVSSFGNKPAAPAPPPASAKAPAFDRSAADRPAGEPAAKPEPKPEQKPVVPGGLKIQHDSAAMAASKQAAAPPPKKDEDELPVELPDIDMFGMGGKKPSEKTADVERPAPAPAARATFVPQGPSEDDIPSMIAMADSYVKAGSFDEAIEMFQKALAMDPGNFSIKKKLTDVYSKYAGLPVAGAPDMEAKKKEEEAKKKAEDEAKKKREEDEKKKKADDEAGKKADEARRKKEEEDKRKKDEETKKKADEEAKKKREEDDRKKRDEEAARKKREEEDKKKKTAAAQEDLVDDEYSDDFVTVTTAEIFIKQGLFTEAEKILGKILKKDPANIEAKMKLDEMKKLQAETEQKGENVMDEAVEKGKQSKVSYI